MKFLHTLFFGFAAFCLCAQTPVEKVRQFRSANEHAILSEYFEFLAIPNHASDKPNIARNAAFIEAMLQKRGVQTRLLDSRTPGTPKAVYGEVLSPGATETILFYAHYDGQPVSPEKVPHPRCESQRLLRQPLVEVIAVYGLAFVLGISVGKGPGK